MIEQQVLVSGKSSARKGFAKSAGLHKVYSGTDTQGKPAKR